MKDIYRNPAWTGTAQGAMFSHYEIGRVIEGVDEHMDIICEQDDEREPGPNERVLWTIYGRFDPAVANGFGGVDALVDTGTYERAVEILRQMIGNLDQHHVQ